MTGTYAGGSLNFVAVGRELELPSALFAAATAADNVMTAVWIGATLMLLVLLGRYYPPVPEAPPGRGAPGRGHHVRGVPGRRPGGSALVLPGAMAGLLGYAAGNYVAFGVVYLMRAVHGG